MAVGDPQVEQYRNALKTTGVTLVTSSKNPYATVGGIILWTVGVALPSNKHSKEVTCASSFVFLPAEFQVLHYAAIFGNNDDKELKYTIDDDKFYKNDAGGAAQNYLRIEYAKPEKQADGTIRYGIVAKNLATEKPFYRHLRLLIDVAE